MIRSRTALSAVLARIARPHAPTSSASAAAAAAAADGPAAIAKEDALSGRCKQMVGAA